MKKLFISQPMRGKTDEELLAVRAQAIQSAERVLEEEVEVIDSFFKDAVVPSTVLSRPLWFLGKSIKLLSGADVAYFADGWEDARGCKIEHECAVEYGITTIENYRRRRNGCQICSECGEEHEWDEYRAAYCDVCGAEMEAL